MPRLEDFVDVQGFSGSTRRMFPNRWAGSLGEKAWCCQETREVQVTNQGRGWTRPEREDGPEGCRYVHAKAFFIYFRDEREHRLGVQLGGRGAIKQEREQRI